MQKTNRGEHTNQKGAFRPFHARNYIPTRRKRCYVRQTMPSFIYGTAWKKEATTGLVKSAAKAGFTAFDTANQPKHYQEPLVGDALAAFAAEGISRSSLFVQT